MDSKSKIAISTATLESICRDRLGRRLAASRELADGWFNTIHLLELEDGGRAVLKVAPPASFTAMRYEKDILATEVAVHRRLAAAGLRVPAILADCPDGEGLGHAYFIMECLEGEAWSKLRPGCPADRQASVDGVIARQTAAVNAIPGPRFGRWREDVTAASTWSASFLAMVDDLLADAADKDVALPRSAAAIRGLVQASRGDLDRVTQPRLVLWDLHDGNVMVDPRGPELSGFLDTDRALWGDPLMEFPFRNLAQASTAWREGYRAACAEAGQEHPADTPGAERRLALYELYLALVMVVEVAYRGFDAGHEAWTRDYLDQAMVACGIN
jgi:aminoglycoside phosphotransferase (APT) family kinase protein